MKNAYKIALIALFVLSGLGIATYTVASNDNSVIACVNKADGATRIINFLTSRCRPTEDVLTWAVSNAGAATPGAGNVAFTHDSFLLLNSGDVVYADFVSGQPKYISFAEYDKDNDMPNFSPLPLSIGRIAAWNYDSFLEKGGHFWKYKYSTNQWIDFGAAPEEVLAQCEDGIDNDGDSLVDLKDDGCTDPSDESEEVFVLDVTAEFSTSPDNPNSSYIGVSNSSATNGVILTVAELEANGNSDITLEELPVTIYANSSSSISSIVKKVYLYEGSVLLGAETVSPSTDESGILVFDNIDYTLAADDTIELTIKADINGLEGNYSQGDSIAISISPENIASSTIFDLNGNVLPGENKTGSVEGQPQAFYVSGIDVALVDSEITKIEDENGDITQVTYSMEFEVTAFGEDRFFGPQAEYAADASIASTSVVFLVEDAGGAATTTATLSSTLSSSADVESNGAYQIYEGETETVTLQVNLTATQVPNSFYRIQAIEFQSFGNMNLTAGGFETELIPEVDFDTNYQLLNN